MTSSSVDRTLRAPGRFSKARRGSEPYAFILPTALLITVLMIVPIVMVIGYSFSDNVITNKHPELVWLANYAEVLGDPVFHTAVINTVVFTVGSVAAHLVLGLAFAMMLNTQLLSRFTKALFRTVYILPWLFTAAVIAVLWRLLLSPNGVVNYLLDSTGIASGQVEWLSNPDLALGSVTFINIWAGYPFFMISLLAGLQGIPHDLYEAATVDGANGIQKFFSVTIPQLRPIIISMLLLDLIWTSQQFALIWMTTGGGPINVTEMLSTYTYKLAFSRYEFALASTSAVLVLALSMVLAVFYVRHQRARD
ncbi:carbohydrate ABC transporter permease [Herbiconiux ginsengi]|uniref:Carbohydrate ABC transporter membrane protein 1, CUT1 family n=1 Tax=Herbiconiux ginsengi TaxID=381665 RepID=A0A1H3RER7_9MICO|nr:sugar ABC transporter permease [Herbiconiux ginsengi]SDZ23825.1 carbohydrate ABC transporter membrane protein 1, CUT1 family [Herbiconiux ginsengi]